MHKPMHRGRLGSSVSRVLCPAASLSVTFCCRVLMLPVAAQRLCETFLVHGLTVALVFKCDEWSYLPRDLECVEILSGVGSVAGAASEHGLRAAAYDKGRIPGLTESAEDITTPQGFRAAIALVMRLVCHGLLWLAPPCSSWTFLNSSRCRRSAENGYRGDCTYGPVATGNCTAEASVFLCLLAVSRQAKVGLENPIGSEFFKFGPIMDMEKALGMISATTYRCAFSVAPFGKRYNKAYSILACGCWVRGLVAVCRCPERKHIPLVDTKVGSDGRIRTTGIKRRLTESAAYPIAMGHRIVEAACPGHAAPVQCPVPGPKSGTKKRTSKKKEGALTVVKSKIATIAKSQRQRPNSGRPAADATNAANNTTRSWLTPSALAPPAASEAPRSRAWCSPAASSTSTVSSRRPAWAQPRSE